MNTSRKWAAACCAVTLFPLLASTLVLLILQPAILATYNLAYKGRPLPLAISDFVASPVVPWVLLAIPVMASGIVLFWKRPTVETAVFLSLGNLAYTVTLLVCYVFVGVGVMLSWNTGVLSSP